MTLYQTRAHYFRRQATTSDNCAASSKQRITWTERPVCQTVHMARTCWIDLFTVETWKESQDHGSDMSGFSEALGDRELPVALGLGSRVALVSSGRPRVEQGEYLLE